MQLWFIESVNDESDSLTRTLLHSREREDRTLNLSDHFQAVWEAQYPVIKTAKQIILVVGPEAGFSDSRIIYMWLQSHALFTGVEFWTSTSDYHKTIQGHSDTEIIELISSAVTNHHTNLPYMREVRIGNK